MLSESQTAGALDSGVPPVLIGNATKRSPLRHARRRNSNCSFGQRPVARVGGGRPRGARISAALSRPPAQRPALVRLMCREDDGLREKVESHLSAIERVDNFIEQPAVATRSLSGSFPGGWIPDLGNRTLKPGDSVGPYTIVEFLRSIQRLRSIVSGAFDVRGPDVAEGFFPGEVEVLSISGQSAPSNDSSSPSQRGDGPFLSIGKR